MVVRCTFFALLSAATAATAAEDDENDEMKRGDEKKWLLL